MTVSFYRLVKAVYRTAVPRRFDRFMFDGRSGFSRSVLKVKERLEKGASHDQLYDDVYFARQDEHMRRSSRGIAESIRERLPDVASVIDVGCGSGAVLHELRQRGIEGRGLEYADAALDICRAKGLDVLKFDLESGAERPGFRSDLVLSTEVAEHLPAPVADAYVELLTGMSDLVIVTAATPGQGGTDHVNEQPNGYWIEKFAARGFVHDQTETDAWRADWATRGVDRQRARNVMIFRRQAS